SQPGALQRVGSAAPTFVLLQFNYLVSSTGEGSRNPLADCRLHGLLVLSYYLNCVVGDESMTDRSNENATADSLSKGKTHFSDFPYCKALENAIAMLSVDRVDIEGKAHSGSHVRLPFASRFDTLGM
ncbi:hypothetical protein H0E87_015521, partial [Populus deltoides]